jgi:hypothetical protein
MLATMDATRPTTRPSASINTHFFSTVAGVAERVTLVSAFMGLGFHSAVPRAMGVYPCQLASKQTRRRMGQQRDDSPNAD